LKFNFCPKNRGLIHFIAGTVEGEEQIHASISVLSDRKSLREFVAKLTPTAGNEFEILKMDPIS
jgi:hypothetical protein